MPGQSKRIAHRVGLFVLASITALGFSTDSFAAQKPSLIGTFKAKDWLQADHDVRQVAYNSPPCNSPCPPYYAAPDGSAGSRDTMQYPSDEAAAPVPRAMPRPEQFAGMGSRGMTINDTPGGYLDNPIVGTWFRLRYDNATGANRPDRAEYLYASRALDSSGVGFGYTRVPSNFNLQDVTAYFEYALGARFSLFGETGARFIDATFPPGATQFNQNTGGLGDSNAGFKLAIINSPYQYLTFQYKVYLPTGDPGKFLGTNHVSHEPSLLYLSKWTDRLYFQGQLGMWVPVGGTQVTTGTDFNGNPIHSSFAGDILRYGFGWGYDVIRRGNGLDVRQIYTSNQGLRVTPVLECFGWTVMNGFESINPPASASQSQGRQVVSARGDTIINLKLGVRTSFGPRSIYAGWGHALTGDRWYADLFRLEYRRMF